jgi:hypothetical protein
MDWELRTEDIDTVLDRHATSLDPAQRERVVDDVLLEADRIEELVFEHSGFEARRAALLSAIEDVLIEQDVIDSDKLFRPEDVDVEEEEDAAAQEEADEGEDYLS